MTNPKQALTPFSQVYAVKRRAISPVHVPEMAVQFAAAPSLHEYLEKSLASLQAFSVSTVEEVAALAHLDKRGHSTLVEDLGLPGHFGEQLLDDFRKTDRGAVEVQDWGRYDQMDYALGCDLNFEVPPLEAPGSYGAGLLAGSHGGDPPAPPDPGVATATPVQQVNLIDLHMSPIRDQGSRGTCVAFSSMSCLEYHVHRFAAQPGVDLSEQFAYWNMVMRTGQRNLVSCFPLLKSDGACLEQIWPYYPNPVAGNDSQGPPPPTAQTSAMAYRPTNILQLPPRSVPDIQDAIRQGRVVAIGIPVYRSWFQSPVVRKYGNITVPFPGEVPDPVGHAIALVGFEDNQDFAGGGFFIVRNSWDSYWATASSFGPGYGTIPYKYIASFNWDAWCLW